MKNIFKGANCIITGGSGFIGQHLVKRMLSLGANVWVIDNFSFGGSPKFIDNNAIIIEGDVRDRKIYTSLPKRRYQYYFHFAAPSSTALFTQMNAECIDITTAGFLNALNFCTKNDVRLVYPSSGSLYSGIRLPHHEKAKLNHDALNSYAKNKALLEKMADLYRPACDSIGLRILAGYGPGEAHKKDHAGIVYSFCRDIVANRQPVIWGDGQQRRDFVFIKDIIDAISILAVNCPEPVINIGTGLDISFNEVVDIINKCLGTKVLPLYVEKPQLYLEKTLADTRLLRKYYKKPFTDIGTGIQKTINSILKK